ncbi:MAG: hypothetical protein A2X12_05990 [Bacteroidetes bacterium GWE2_29_8]|nr:MAG: hypothetical protein A2X12_05990 [Bacteroidetes bacterium GWE2_29_8]OFY20047.1 MAG: hypothetical protein A2X02_06690 [Bacteroidetes bacterium GWF2_29_10]
MKNIVIVGAGQLGSRHLQALKTLDDAYNVFVIDTNQNSLSVSKERYNSMQIPDKNNVKYYDNFEQLPKDIEILINATNSNNRREIIEKILNFSNIKFMILEKILFAKKDDYFFIGDLIKNKGVKTWVNFSMRDMDFYFNLKKDLPNKQIIYQVVGSQYGLVTNAIHYLDHLVYLTDCKEFSIDTSLIDKNIIQSKRAGFNELNGVLSANFKNGSRITICCYPFGNNPVVVEIISPDIRLFYKESEGKVLMSKGLNDWDWLEIDAPITYQSQRTNKLVSDLTLKGDCNLTKYEDSVLTHIQLLDPLLSFINNNSNNKLNYYPFT